MHTVIGIASLALLMWLIARILAHSQDADDRPSAIARGLWIGATIGGACAVVFLTTQIDLVPDELESALLPVALILVSLGLVIGTWYRAAWR